MSLKFKNLHILVVEDIAPMQQLLHDLLVALGVGRVTRARDGIEGYRAYAKEKPDLIITDWQMPNMDGLELIQKIRRDPKSHNRTIPIIMLTGFCAMERIALARNNGITEFIAKPFTAGDITKRITHIISTPRDFILTPHFIGPDRRRKEDEDYDGPSHRIEETDKKIKACTKLQEKTGIGPVDPQALEKSQKIIDDNKMDFVPLALEFIAQLAEATAITKREEAPKKQALDRMIYPIMQIKANARIFKYELVGDLADIMLNFLENLNEIDEFVLEIIDAHHKTLAHLIDKQMSGEGGEIGGSLQDELKSACNRYMNIRSQLQQKKLIKE